MIKYAAKIITGDLRPLPSFIYKYFPDGKKIIEDDQDLDTYRKNSIWAQNFSEHWAKNIIPSCGPWIFEGMTERQITFKRNPDYYFLLPHSSMEKRMPLRKMPIPYGKILKQVISTATTYVPNNLLSGKTFHIRISINSKWRKRIVLIGLIIW